MYLNLKGLYGLTELGLKALLIKGGGGPGELLLPGADTAGQPPEGGQAALHILSISNGHPPPLNATPLNCSGIHTREEDAQNILMKDTGSVADPGCLSRITLTRTQLLYLTNSLAHSSSSTELSSHSPRKH